MNGRRRAVILDLPEQEEERYGAPAWVVTYGDMMSLLLCFFVMLLAFSTMEAERFKIVSGYIRDTFGVQAQRRQTDIPLGRTILESDASTPLVGKSELFEKTREALAPLDLELDAEILVEERGVRVRIGDGPLFKPGSAALEPAAGLVLTRLSHVARDTGVRAVVEGHSDSLPVRPGAYPSNWELSGARAGAVVRFMGTRGVPQDRMEAVGFADTRPIGDNTTDDGRRRNRRVEIVFETAGRGLVGVTR